MSQMIHPFEGVQPTLGEDVFIAPGAQVIGDVVVGQGSGIWYNCVVRGDTNEIRIGKHVNVQDGTVIHVASRGQGTYIGDRVSIGHLALVHACTIEDDAFIGMKAVVMDNAIVEAGAMVAAGALVTPGKRVKAGELWAGSPAIRKRLLTDADKAMMSWTWEHYSALAKRHSDSLSP